MNTPKFWARKSLISYLLYPISLIYGFVAQVKLKYIKSYKSSAKVICIGNITAGGVGKTPVAIYFAKKYLSEGKKVVFLTRGYKGKLKDIIVDLDNHTVEQTGDEARLLANVAPTIIAPNRAKGALIAESIGAEVIIMDDGFQNPTLYKDESYLVFDGSLGVGNNMLIPAGALRESLINGQKRATAVIIMGNDKTNLSKYINLPIYYGDVVAQNIHLENKNVLAFAGIGHPIKFYNSLKKTGFNVVITKDFPDHYAYSDDDIISLIKLAEANSLELITTQKDLVKMPQKYISKINCLYIEANFTPNI